MSILEDPYPVYEEMRQSVPVCWDPRRNLWVLTRYRDVVTALREPKLGSASAKAGQLTDARTTLPAHRLFASQVELSDPPLHTRLRRRLRAAFAELDWQEVHVFVQSTTDALIDTLIAAGGGNIVEDLARPLSHAVLIKVLGVGGAEQALLEQSIDRLMNEFERSRSDTDDLAQASIDDLMTIVDDVSRERRAGLIASLASTRPGQEPLSDDEIIANVALLFAAGHGTTANLIANGLLALLRHPDQMRLIGGGRHSITAATEEMLRYDSPIQSVARVALDDVEVGGGHVVRRGHTVILNLGSSNRDEEFPEANRFRIDRPRTTHVAFGAGAHFCLGASLARLQCQVAIATILRRCPELHLVDDQVSWYADPTFRGVKSLPVSCRDSAEDTDE